jgi:hypothetical protein
MGIYRNDMSTEVDASSVIVKGSYVGLHVARNGMLHGKKLTHLV